MKYFLIAGEASGDLHASKLIDALKIKDKNAEFCFLGGDLMAESAGSQPIVHYRDMAYMGFIEVAKHISEIIGIMDKAKSAILREAPDVVILIDYPSFNLKIAKFAKNNGIRVVYYISPKIWAWKEYRVKAIKKYVDRLYSILPFEIDFYRKHSYNVEYVGNPSVEEMAEEITKIPSFTDFCKKYTLDSEKQIITIAPGSRKNEIENNLPEMLKAAYQFPDYQVIIAGAPGIDEKYYVKVIKTEGSYEIPKIISGDTFALIRNSRAALVTSGTATLEAALLNTPQVACYRMSGSRIVYNIFSHILKVKYVTLPNLITNSPVIPELLLHNCNKKTIAATLEPLLSHSPKRDEMLSGYVKMKEILGTKNCADATASSIQNLISKKDR